MDWGGKDGGGEDDCRQYSQAECGYCIHCKWDVASSNCIHDEYNCEQYTDYGHEICEGYQECTWNGYDGECVHDHSCGSVGYCPEPEAYVQGQIYDSSYGDQYYAYCGLSACGSCATSFCSSEFASACTNECNGGGACNQDWGIVIEDEPTNCLDDCISYEYINHNDAMEVCLWYDANWGTACTSDCESESDYCEMERMVHMCDGCLEAEANGEYGACADWLMFGGIISILKSFASDISVSILSESFNSVFSLFNFLISLSLTYMFMKLLIFLFSSKM